MRSVALGAILVAFVVSSGSAQQQSPQQAPPSDPAAAQQPEPATQAASVERGRDIAESGTASGAVPCASCHGMDGASNGSDAFPRLDGQPAYYLFKQLNDYASGNRENPIMGPIAESLSPAERQDTAAYYGSLGIVATPAPQTDQQAMRLGAEIVDVGIAERGVQACVNCHGPEARGLPPTVPRLAGQWATYTLAQFEAFRDGTRKNDIVAVMRDLSHRLGDAEAAAVSAYLEALRPAANGGP